MKSEVGLTVSIGVSFNKIFAKLGSDMKKPDAVTVITPESFRDQVWPLPASDLLYVGRATTEKLRRYGITTIGDLARSDMGFITQLTWARMGCQFGGMPTVLTLQGSCPAILLRQLRALGMASPAPPICSTTRRSIECCWSSARSWVKLRKQNLAATGRQNCRAG